MNLRSTISVTKGSQILTIHFVPNDVPINHLAILVRYYSSQEDAERLIRLGNLARLAASTDAPEGHSFHSPLPGFSVALGRDRGDRKFAARRYKSIEDALASEGQERNYLWDGTEWSLLV